MSKFTGLALASIITGTIGAHGLVFGDASPGEIFRGFLAGASFSVIFGALLAIIRWMDPSVTSPESRHFALVAMASGLLSGALAGGLWFATQHDPPGLYLCFAIGGIVGFGFGWAGSRDANPGGTSA
jgi:hypothetical protein